MAMGLRTMLAVRDSVPFLRINFGRFDGFALLWLWLLPVGNARLAGFVAAIGRLSSSLSSKSCARFLADGFETRPFCVVTVAGVVAEPGVGGTAAPEFVFVVEVAGAEGGPPSVVTAGVGGCDRFRTIRIPPPGVAGGGDMAEGVATSGFAIMEAALGVRSFSVTGFDAFAGGGGDAMASVLCDVF